MKVPQECVHFIVKIPKTGEKYFEVTVGLRKGPDLSVKYLIKAEKFVVLT
jgi:hypothetical protein